MLAIVFAGLIAFIILMYVLLDGFDLGIGILFPFSHSESERDQMMNAVAPVWDGNETWLVFGGAMLYGAFPKAYGMLLPILYMPLMLMLVALVFRGVSFEFRFKAKRTKVIWNWAFAISSMAATFFQGVVLGDFIQGFPTHGVGVYVSDPDWITPFSLLTGFALVCGYSLLGACWLIMKTHGRLQQRMRELAKGLLVLVVFFMVFVSIWTPLHNDAIFARWYSWPNVAYLSILPLLSFSAAFLCFKKLNDEREKNEWQPFVCSLLIFLGAYLGAGISVYPYIIPHMLTIWEAQAPDTTLWFILIGVLIMLPILLAYTVYAYWVFWGKNTEGYHG